MRFTVPQHLELEEKLVKNLTFKQLSYLVGGLGLCFVIYSSLPSVLGFPLIGIVIGFSLALSFLKVNDRPFIIFLYYFVVFSLKSKVYFWKKEGVQEDIVVKKDETIYKPISGGIFEEQKIKSRIAEIELG